MTPEQTAAEIERLNMLIRARDGKVGYAANVEALKARIAQLQEPAPVDG